MRVEFTHAEAMALIAAAKIGSISQPEISPAKKSDCRRAIGIIEDALRFDKPKDSGNYVNGEWTGEPPESGMW